MVASLMETKKEITGNDIQAIRDSIKHLQNTIDEFDLSKSAREALLELVRLNRFLVGSISLVNDNTNRTQIKFMIEF